MSIPNTKIVTFCVALTLPLAMSLWAPEATLSGSVYAAQDEKKEKKYKNVKTNKRQSVGAKCGKALEKLQVSLEEELWAESLNALKNIESSSKTCKSDYEQTQIWKFSGYIYYSLDDFPNAIKAYRKVVDGAGTPPEVKLDTRYTLAQLYASEEDYPNAAVQLEAWLAEATIIGADQRYFLAQIYYQLDRKRDALNMVELAISDVESRSILPKERYWGLQRVLYYEKNDYPMVISILEKLVKHYPKWSYWKQLGGMYGEREREMDRLVATELVYLNDELKKESEVMSMAYMYLGAEVPYRAAKIIDRGMQDGIVERSAKNLEVLGTAWYQSRDLSGAVGALEAASKVADNGNLQARLAGIYLDLGRDKDAYRAASRAAKKGGVKRPDSNYLVMGNALINLNCFKDAISAFKNSLKKAKDKKSKKYPRQWIKFAESEGSRLQKLRDVGLDIRGCGKA